MNQRFYESQSYSSVLCVCPQADSSPSNVAPPRTEAATSEPVKVTITKVFDFAGEEVRYDPACLSLRAAR